MSAVLLLRGGLVATLVDDGLSLFDVAHASEDAVLQVARCMRAPGAVFLHLVVDFLGLVEHEADFGLVGRLQSRHFKELLQALEPCADLFESFLDRGLPLEDFRIDRRLVGIAQSLVKRARRRAVAPLSVARERVVARRGAAAGPDNVDKKIFIVKLV